MILVVVKQPVRAKYADDWPELVREYTEATRAEPGNISFDWYRSPEDPNLWILVEVFADKAAGDAHTASEHFAKASGEMARWCAAIPEIIHMEGPGEGWSLAGEAS
ncbi:MAG: antibiotic biosynthesis monooxygenase [Microthrixaceae bacterium]|nr:antibiotic biosynthesis monooxygenase [Microthrixaceae bacterium]MCO5311330.1 antibiotic biosynthesis monooxygenase [Microthrixaceae bacterium]HPB45410.1 putative quinol monooxygenase [Microthrixaceae bacterium]